MANVQETQTIIDATKRAVVKALRLNDGAGNDAAVTIIDASALSEPGSTGDEVLSIVSVIWTSGGPTAAKTITLYWDGSPDEPIMTLNGNGTWNLNTMGLPPLLNNAASPSGDILLTTTGFVSGDNYTVLLEVHKVSGFEYVSSSSSSSST